MQLTDTIQIRQMEKPDLELMAEWSADAFTSTDIGLHWTKEKMLKHLRDDFKPEYSFVIFDETGMLGGIMAYPCKYDQGEEVFLHTIVMKKDQQQKGLGKKFMQWFIEYVKKEHKTGIRLDAHVRLPSYHWYKQFGFEPSGWEQQILELE